MTVIPPIPPIGAGGAGTAGTGADVGAGALGAVGGAQQPFATTGPEWQVGAGGATPAVEPAGGFGKLLSDQISQLDAIQDTAAQQSQALAAGTASDVSSVVMAVERAQLSMQLASQVRGKLTEAFQDIFHTQV